MCARLNSRDPAYTVTILCMCARLNSRDPAYTVAILCMCARLNSRDPAYTVTILCTLYSSNNCSSTIRRNYNAYYKKRYLMTGNCAEMRFK